MNAPTSTNPEQAKRLEGVLAALRRARRHAEDLAIATGTEIVENHNGAVVLITPSEILGRRKKADAEQQGGR